MNLEQLISQIEKNGCKVILVNETEVPGDECDGTFDIVEGIPTIVLAIKYKRKIRIRYILMHEYAHYLQWVDGYMRHIDRIIDGWLVFSEWLNGKEYSKEELHKSRNAMLLIEYDADVRVLGIARDYGIRIDKKKHIREANSYAALIKWAFKNRRWCGLPPSYNFSTLLQSPHYLIGPLDDRSNALLSM